MIVKSMARKEPTFEQLYDYITRHKIDSKFIFTQNIFSKQREGIIREFQENSKFIRKTKNGNYLYHEIISITRAKKLSTEKQKEILFEIVSKYTQTRAKDCLIFGGLHDEKGNNLHIHLMISANEFELSKRHRLAKKYFDKIKKNLELYVLEQYPELEQKKLITQDKSKRENKAKITNKEWEYKRRTGKLSKKEELIQNLKNIFSQSKTRQEFLQEVGKIGFRFREKGKTKSFVNLETRKGYRIPKLGLIDEFEAMRKRIVASEKKKDEHSQHKQKNNQYEQAKGRTDRVGNYKSRNKTENVDKDKKENNKDNIGLKEKRINEAKEELKKMRENQKSREYNKERNFRQR